MYPLNERKLSEKLMLLRDKGLKKVSAGNIGTLRLAKRMELKVHGSFDLNILNTRALEAYEEYSLEDSLLSYEINMKDAVSLGGSIKRGLIGYGFLPLMLYRNCPVKSAKGCGTCRGIGKLVDRQQKDFFVQCHNKDYSVLLNSLLCI